MTTWLLGYASDDVEAWKVYSDGTASSSTVGTVDAWRDPDGKWTHKTVMGDTLRKRVCTCSDQMEKLYQDYVKRILCGGESDAYTSKDKKLSI